MSSIKIPLQIFCPNCKQGCLPGSPYCNACGASLDHTLTHQDQSISQGSPTPSYNDAALEMYLSEGQDRALAKQIYERACQILIAEEHVLYISTAHKNGLGRTPDTALATNKRLIVQKKRRLGKAEQDDCFWRDVRGAQTKETRNGITFTVETIQGWHITVEDLPVGQASRLYEIAVEHSERLASNRQKSSPLATEPAPLPVSPPAAATHISQPLYGALPPQAAQAQTTQPAPAYITQSPITQPQLQPITQPNLSRSYLTGPNSTQPIITQPHLQPPPQAAGEQTGPEPSPQSVLQKILRMNRDEQSQAEPVLDAAAFQAPRQVEKQSLAFEERPTSRSTYSAASPAGVPSNGLGQPRMTPGQPNVMPAGNNAYSGSAQAPVPRAANGDTPPYPPQAPIDNTYSGRQTVGRNMDTGSLRTQLLPTAGEPAANGYGDGQGLGAGAHTSSNSGSTPPAGQAKPGRDEDPIRKMKLLKDMLEAGLIDAQDYEEKKAEILAKF